MEFFLSVTKMEFTENTVIIDEVALVSKFYGINVCFFYLLQGYHFDFIKNAIFLFKKIELN